MALDGRMLYLLAEEIREACVGCKVDKVCQPERDGLVLTLRGVGGNRRLLLSASTASARVCLTEVAAENPAVPPMFCMLLRKHLIGGRLADVSTAGLERVLALRFECHNEFGDRVDRCLIAEIMGKHSNIILSDEKGIILDAVKRIDFTASSVRQVLPGLRYEHPPFQDKVDPLQVSPEELTEEILRQGDMAADKAILSRIQGFSPVVCREIAYTVLRGGSKPVCQFTEDEKIRLKVILTRVLIEKPVPCLAADSATQRPIEFSFVELHQYGTAVITRVLPTFSSLVETAFFERTKADTQKRKQEDILRILSTAYDRIQRKISAQKNDLLACKDKEKYRKYGDLLSSNLWALKKGMDSCCLDDYYDGGQVDIPLDSMLTPAQNAQKYYKKYRKADTAEKILTEQIVRWEKELHYLDTVFDELTRAESSAEIQEIRQELTQSGYIRPERGAKQKAPVFSPRKFVTDEGLTVLCGRNNVQNDHLTLKATDRDYLWFHAKDIPGSHVVLVADTDGVKDLSLTQAAILAATFSKASEAGKVPVDYTKVRYVKKPSGAKPGMVIYTNQQTIFVTPDPALANRLEQK